MSWELIKALWRVAQALGMLGITVFGAVEVWRGKTVEGLLWMILASVNLVSGKEKN